RFIPVVSLVQIQFPLFFYFTAILAVWIKRMRAYLHGGYVLFLMDHVFAAGAERLTAGFWRDAISAGQETRTGGIMRIGSGYDVHRLTEGRKLILGGVEIPFEKGLLGHSDADVLVHAVMDALLGAAALKDIGYHFPEIGRAHV